MVVQHAGDDGHACACGAIGTLLSGEGGMRDSSNLPLTVKISEGLPPASQKPVPCKPGVHEWWESCMRESLVGMGGLDEEELRRLKPKERMVKCMSRTQTLGNIF